MQEILLKKDILKEDYRKILRNLLYFFFWTQSLLMDKIIKNKRDLELSFISYVLSDHIIRTSPFFKGVK